MSTIPSHIAITYQPKPTYRSMAKSTARDQVAASVAPVARPIDEWHEDMGAVLWWRFPVEEPPYCGAPLDTEWVPGYYTHFTPIVVPQPPRCGEVLG